MNKLNWKVFEPLFGTWANKIKPFFDSGQMDVIYEKLKEEARRGYKIAPNSNLTFRAFQETDIDNLQLIIVGMCPYHSFYNDQPVADGLCMSCSVTGKLQPTLLNFYDAIERELYDGLCVPCTRNPDLTFLARDNGVLLLNAALTTTKGKAGNHIALWNEFMKYLFENVFDTAGVPILLLGKEAQKLEKYITPFSTVIKVSHPAFAAYQNEEWNSEGCFKQIQTILKYRNNQEINWFDSSEIIPF